MEDSFDYEIKDDATEISETESTELNTEISGESSLESGNDKGEQKEESNNLEPKAEDGLAAYTPNLKYKIKDEEKEFPEAFKSFITSKENEDLVRDLFTKADAMEGIKASRDQVEVELNNYKQDIENKYNPLVDRVTKFDQALNTGDYVQALAMANVDPTDFIKSLVMDDKYSDVIYSEVLKILDLEQNGPQALEAQRNAHNEKINANKLMQQNEMLKSQIQSSNEQIFNDQLRFAMNQHSDKVSVYEQSMGPGSFERMVRAIGNEQYNAGNPMGAVQAVEYSLKALNLESVNNLQAATNNVVNAQVTPKEKPAIIPNVGVGASESMVGKQAANWDEYTKRLSAS